MCAFIRSFGKKLLFVAPVVVIIALLADIQTALDCLGLCAFVIFFLVLMEDNDRRKPGAHF